MRQPRYGRLGPYWRASAKIPLLRCHLFRAPSLDLAAVAHENAKRQIVKALTISNARSHQEFRLTPDRLEGRQTKFFVCPRSGLPKTRLRGPICRLAEVSHSADDPLRELIAGISRHGRRLVPIGDEATDTRVVPTEVPPCGGWREMPQEHQVRLGVRAACDYSDEELMRIIGIDDPNVTREQAAVTARRIIEVNPGDEFGLAHGGSLIPRRGETEGKTWPSAMERNSSPGCLSA